MKVYKGLKAKYITISTQAITAQEGKQMSSYCCKVHNTGKKIIWRVIVKELIK